MRIDIIRIEQSNEGTFGILLIKKKIFCMTLERPWMNNEKNVSCIPEAMYKAKRIQSPTFGEVYQLLDVPMRTHVLIHTGNTINDTQGCILLGGSFGLIGESRAVLNSKDTLINFMKETELSDELIITIRNAYV